MMGKLVLLVVMVFCYWPPMTDGACELMPQSTQRYRHCKSEIEGEDGLLIHCDVYALAQGRFSILPNSSIGITVTSTFHTKLNLTKDGQSSKTTNCLTLNKGRVQKLDPVKDRQVLQKANKYLIPQEAMFLLMSIKVLDIQVNFQSDQIVGSVTYDPDCVRRRLSRNESDDVSGCVRMVDIYDSIAMPGNSLQTNNINISQLVDKDSITNILLFVDNFWLQEFNGIIQSFTLTLLNEFANFPTMAIAFLAMKQVSAIYLPNNYFRHIEKDDFPAIPTLEILDLSSCKLTSIDDSAFRSLPNLRHLDLRHNQLPRISQAIAFLPNLKTLDLSGNGEQFYVTPNVIQQLKNLQVLDLSTMKIRMPNNFGHEQMANVSVLNLSRTSLEELPPSFCHTFPNLQTLILSNNKLTAGKFMKNNWKLLEFLDLASNKFGGNFNFNNFLRLFPNLTRLNLANNSIPEIPSIHLENNSIYFLNFSNNLIGNWNSTKFNKTRLSIDLSGNNITEVSSAMMDDFSNITKVNLAGNPWNCNSCLLPAFQKWLSEHKNVTDFQQSPYRCVYPIDSVGKIITKVEIDHELCLEKLFDWLMNVVLPIAIVLGIFSAGAIALYQYWWHFKYFWHLFQAKIEVARSGQEANVASSHRYDAFVSYCSHDELWVVRHMIPAMEQQHPVVHLCVHERDFALGGYIINNVIDSIDCSRKSIFVISKKFIDSRWCQWELQMAQHKLFEDKKDVLVLVLLEELKHNEIPKTLRRLMSSRTYLIWPKNNNEAALKLFWARLKHYVGECNCLQKQLQQIQMT